MLLSVWSSPRFELGTLRIRVQCDEFRRRYVLCIQKLYNRPHFAAGGSWNKSLHLQPLQRRYRENSGSPSSACVMRRHYSITYTQSLHTINGLLAVERVGNLLCGRPWTLKMLL